MKKFVSKRRKNNGSNRIRRKKTRSKKKSYNKSKRNIWLLPSDKVIGKLSLLLIIKMMQQQKILN